MEDSSLVNVDQQQGFVSPDMGYSKRLIGQQERSFDITTICFLVVIGPLCLGGNLFLFLPIVAGIGGVMAISLAYATVSGKIQINPSSYLPTALVILFFLALSFQVVPLPTFLVELLAASRSSFDPLALDEPLLETISLSPERTLQSICWFFGLTMILATIVFAAPREGMFLVWLPKQRRQNIERTLLYRACQNDRSSNLLELSVVLAGIISALVAVCSWALKTESLFGLWEGQQEWLVRQDRLHWPFVNPNHLSALLTVSLIFSFSRLLRFSFISRLSLGPDPTLSSKIRFLRNPERFGVQVFYALATGVLVVANILTLSRAGNALSFASVILLYIVWRQTVPRELSEQIYQRRSIGMNRLISKLPVGYIGALCLMGVVVFLLGARGSDVIFSRLSYGLSSGYDEIRQRLLVVTMQIVTHFPIFGIGLGCWELVAPMFFPQELGGLRFAHAHNDPLELVAELGVIGGLIALCFYLYLLFRVLAVWKQELIASERLELMALCLVTVIPVLHSLVDFPFHIPALALVYTVSIGLLLRETQRLAENKNT